MENSAFVSIPVPKTLSEAAVIVLTSSDPETKKELTLDFAKRWKSGEITEIGNTIPPIEPSRPTNVEIVSPLHVPKRGKGGSLASRQAMIHSLVHIENVAIDLSWDIIARFTHVSLPKQFYDDWVKVAEDEARHYGMLVKHLEEMGSYYGAMSAHAGLWDSAKDTMHDLKSRLAIEHIVQEGHGLDVTPKTIARFRSNGDKKSASLLEVILRDEITHVTAGITWFKYLCEKESIDPKETFSEMVPKYFRGLLKPPFNKQARDSAGMPEDWYIPLSRKPTNENNNNSVDTEKLVQ